MDVGATKAGSVANVVATGASAAHEPRRRRAGGRQRDHSRDRAILDATLDVLAENGWEGLTMELVAQRSGAGKATLYRRWPSKTELILDSVLALAGDCGGAVSGSAPPDTGSLVGDIVALLHPRSPGERDLKVMAAVSSMMLHHVELAAQLDTALYEPWVQANRTAIQRAIERGEFDAHADIDTLSRVLPAMAAYRILLQHRDLDREHLITLVEQILIPALRAADTPTH